MINRKLVLIGMLGVAAAASIALVCAVAGGAEGSRSTIATPTEKTSTMNIQIKVCNKRFTATLEDNATDKTFKALLPMNTQTPDLNRNEKYFCSTVTLTTTT